jgi:gliding motility-associated-like protein
LPVVRNSGIAVDSCNNLYLGADSGRVYVYRFDGAKFNHINVIQVISDSTRNSRVYDVVYNYDAHMIYVSGDSFAAAVNCGTPCGNKIRLETSNYRSCGDPLWAKIINPDSSITYTFEWRKPLKNELVRSVTGKYKFSDSLVSLTPNTTYKLYVFVSPFCTGTFKTKNFEVRSSFDSTMDVKICEGDTLFHNGKAAFQTGKYIDSLKTYFGCDSIATYKLTVLKRSVVDTLMSICLGDSAVLWGKIYRQAGLFRDTFVNHLGCDSIQTLRLKVYFDSVSQVQTRCLGDTVWVGKKGYTKTGIYTDTLRSSKNCDSVIVTNLTVNMPVTTLSQLDFCNVDSLSYRGKNYAIPFKLRDSLYTWQGCDSVFLLEVNGHWVNADFTIDSSDFPEYRFLENSTGAKLFQWDFGDLSKSNTATPFHTFVKSYQGMVYKVCLVVEDAFGCQDTVCKNVWVRPMKDIFIPEGISPNGDGINDSLDLTGLWAFPDAEWTIFNRWGQVVFFSNARNPVSWNGKCNTRGCNGRLLPEGVYFIVFDYHDGLHKRVNANIYLKQ